MVNGNHAKEGKESFFCSRVLLKLYRLADKGAARSVLKKLILKMEGGEWYSVTVRRVFSRFHSVDVGLYTYGCLLGEPDWMGVGTTIGRYCSIYGTARIFTRNHTMNTKSQHPFFYEPALGKVTTHLMSRKRLAIGNDVMIGHNAIILHSVETIGDGAVVSVGSVVTSNVPPFAVVAGSPARIVRFRFEHKTIEKLLEEKWWLKSIDELESSGEIDNFRKPLEGNGPVR